MAHVEEEGRDRSGIQEEVAGRVSRSRFLALHTGLAQSTDVPLLVARFDRRAPDHPEYKKIVSHTLYNPDYTSRHSSASA